MDKLRFTLLIAIITSFVTPYLASDSRSRPIKLSMLEQHIHQMDDTDGWNTEFNSLPAPSTQLKPWNQSLIPENVIKHRYPPPEDNLLTYDATRVILYRFHGNHTSDFINANWVDSYKDLRRYIATQCPIESTISDFYRMVWQHNVHEAVMLASPHDLEKGKCARYFPDDKATHHDIEVVLQRKTEFTDITIRIYTLRRGGTFRLFVHHHFVSWPDLGVPQEPKQLLSLIKTYRSSDSYTRAWPLLVHCSAGVGRTGTFILTDAMYDMAQNEDYVDFFKQLWLIRQQRISMVEKPEQYALAHKVILQAYKEGLFDKNRSQLQYNPHDRSTNETLNVHSRTNQTPANDESIKKTKIIIVDSKFSDQEIVIRLTARAPDNCTS